MASAAKCKKTSHEEENMEEVTKSHAVAIPKKKRGPYKKKNDGDGFLKSRTSRCKQERSYLESLSRIITEMESRTHTPAAYIVFSEGKLIANASSKNLKQFVDDPVVQQLFSKYMLSEMTLESEQVIESEFPADASAEKTNYYDNDYVMTSDWSGYNVWEKRDLVCDIVKWMNKGKTRWLDEFKPVWWPVEFEFQSPNTKTNRFQVNDLDLIINSFLNYQRKGTLNDMVINIPSLLSEISPSESFQELYSHCQVVGEKLLLVGDLMDLEKENVAENNISISYRHLVPINSGYEPIVNMEASYSKMFSVAIWGTTKYWQILQYVGFVYNVTNTMSVESFITTGDFGKTGKEIQDSLGLELPLDRVRMEERIMESVNDTKCVLFLHGIVNYLKINCKIINDDSKAFKVVNKYEDDRPVIAFTDVPDIPLMALIQFEFKTLACNNKFCLRVSCDNIVMTCKHCLLTYHQFCVGKSGSDEKCGCDRVREELHCANILKDASTITRNLKHWEKPLMVTIGRIINSKKSSLRLNLLQKTFHDDSHQVPLKSCNRFFDVFVPEDCKQILSDFIDRLVEKHSFLRDLMEQTFDASKWNEVKQKVLFPEVCKEFMKNIIKGGASNMFVERVAETLAMSIDI